MSGNQITNPVTMHEDFPKELSAILTILTSPSGPTTATPQTSSYGPSLFGTYDSCDALLIASLTITFSETAHTLLHDATSREQEPGRPKY